MLAIIRTDEQVPSPDTVGPQGMFLFPGACRSLCKHRTTKDSLSTGLNTFARAGAKTGLAVCLIKAPKFVDNNWSMLGPVTKSYVANFGKSGSLIEFCMVEFQAESKSSYKVDGSNSIITQLYTTNGQKHEYHDWPRHYLPY